MKPSKDYDYDPKVEIEFFRKESERAKLDNLLPDDEYVGEVRYVVDKFLGYVKNSAVPEMDEESVYVTTSREEWRDSFNYMGLSIGGIEQILSIPHGVKLFATQPMFKYKGKLLEVDSIISDNLPDILKFLSTCGDSYILYDFQKIEKTKTICPETGKIKNMDTPEFLYILRGKSV